MHIVYILLTHRNLPVEHIIRKHFFRKCARAESGCAFEGPADAMEDHESKSCLLRTYKCPYGMECGMEIAIQDFSKHMKEEHKEELFPAGNIFDAAFLIGEGTHRSTTSLSWGFVTYTPKAQGIFFPFLCYKGGLFHLWVHSVGDQDMEKRFRVEINISGMYRMQS